MHKDHHEIPLCPNCCPFVDFSILRCLLVNMTDDYMNGVQAILTEVYGEVCGENVSFSANSLNNWEKTSGRERNAWGKCIFSSGFSPNHDLWVGAKCSLFK